MRVKISWDQGSTFERECELEDCIQVYWDGETYREAQFHLQRDGRYWVPFGDDMPSCLLMVVR